MGRCWEWYAAYGGVPLPISWVCASEHVHVRVVRQYGAGLPFSKKTIEAHIRELTTPLYLEHLDGFVPMARHAQPVQNCAIMLLCHSQAMSKLRSPL